MLLDGDVHSGRFGNDSEVTILNLQETVSALRALAKEHADDVKLSVTPFRTAEEREQIFALVGGDAPRVLVLAGAHPRERGGPDHVLHALADMLAARARGAGLRFGNGSRSYSAAEVRTALSAGIAVLPVVNPDGVAYDQATSSCWRKNRNPAGAVDLNRNYGYLWDSDRLFAPAYGCYGGPISSPNPASGIFRGTGPLSEPETRGVAWLMKSLRSLVWSVDVHSFGPLVLYGWGNDKMQTTKPHMSFTNKTYDGLRGKRDGFKPEVEYGEFIEADDLHALETVSSRMATAMTRAGRETYVAGPLSSLYISGGTAFDQALGPYYAHDCGAHRINGMAIEFGVETDVSSCKFYPDAANYRQAKAQVAVGLMELLLTAASDEVKTKIWTCPEVVGV
ncbi:hypothetical protein CP533_0719 [Ophiocordyceps camponoti-saundersi (nom. inval.)]|nr:hypothetical protein CP533_0719 [Ophiocordyceps camponoti-saundersi (nom. inval.)]